MPRLIFPAALIGALCLAIGAHSLALQSVAWGTMLVRNAQQTSFVQALAQTFDGTHPCRLCKGINAAQQSEKKSNTTPLTLKPDLICNTRAIVLRPRSTDSDFSSFTARASTQTRVPPTPPPRFELA
ncbi:MAG: hypothetical protein ACR2F0_06650 [Chthoniobacterales bacterium]